MLGASWVLPSPTPALQPRVTSSILPLRRRQVQTRASTKASHWVALSQRQPMMSVRTRLLHFLFSCCSVAQPCPTLSDPMDCSTPGFPVHHHLPEFAQTHVHHELMMPSNHSSSVKKRKMCIHFGFGLPPDYFDFITCT